MAAYFIGKKLRLFIDLASREERKWFFIGPLEIVLIDLAKSPFKGLLNN